MRHLQRKRVAWIRGGRTSRREDRREAFGGSYCAPHRSFRPTGGGSYSRRADQSDSVRLASRGIFAFEREDQSEAQRSCRRWGNGCGRIRITHLKAMASPTPNPAPNVDSPDAKLKLYILPNLLT